jgi:hypothetical protein
VRLRRRLCDRLLNGREQRTLAACRRVLDEARAVMDEIMAMDRQP